MKEYFVYLTSYSGNSSRPLEKNMIVSTDLTGRPLYDYIYRQAEDNLRSDYKDTIIIKNIVCLWDSAKENINEYWFGTPAWKFKVSWIFPKTLARIFGAPNYTTPSWKMSRVCGDNGLCLK